MTEFIKIIQQVDLMKANEMGFKQRHAGCIVLSQDHKIVLQQRASDWSSFPGCLATFGGHIEANESPIQALVRELNEELGALVKEEDVVSLGAITEAITNYTELIHVYFWYDKHGSITGCYEGEAKYYDSMQDALTHPKIMDYVRWLLSQCQNMKLIQNKK